MYLLNARNPHEALPMGLTLLREHGIEEDTRAGKVLRFPGPVCTTYKAPSERVVFHEWRDANPFFHMAEALWMLAGRNTLSDLTPYVKRMAEFSDDGGITQPGAYGHRWRRWWDGYDQLDWVVRRLRANPSDRRAVIQMWDPSEDIASADANGADVPCNLVMLPYVLGGALHMTIFNRSNDILWGLYGANAVHFSTVLEYLAARLGLPTGEMATISNNFHAYVERMPPDKVSRAAQFAIDPYASGAVEPWPIFYEGMEDFDDNEREVIIREELQAFFEEGPDGIWAWPYLRRVAAPMVRAHKLYKSTGDHVRALEVLDDCVATDWRRAAQEWIERRMP